MTTDDRLRPTEGTDPESDASRGPRGLWKAAGGLCVVSGAQMLVVWPILIGSGQVPELHTQTTYMVFHLSSEAVIAVLCLAAGLGLLLGARWAAWLYFVCASMSLTAITLAIAFYVFSPAPNKTAPLAALVTSGMFTLSTLVALYRRCEPTSPQREARVSAISAGASFYVLVNAAGFAAERRGGYSATYACALLALALLCLWRARRPRSSTTGSSTRAEVRAC